MNGPADPYAHHHPHYRPEPMGFPTPTVVNSPGRSEVRVSTAGGPTSLADAYLHSLQKHPDYEYTSTQGPNEQTAMIPPDGGGWEFNICHRCGCEEFAPAAPGIVPLIQAYWRRRKDYDPSSPQPEAARPREVVEKEVEDLTKRVNLAESELEVMRARAAVFNIMCRWGQAKLALESLALTMRPAGKSKHQVLVLADPLEKLVDELKELDATIRKAIEVFVGKPNAKGKDQQ